MSRARMRCLIPLIIFSGIACGEPTPYDEKANFTKTMRAVQACDPHAVETGLRRIPARDRNKEYVSIVLDQIMLAR